jgi:hypothetical protein
LNFPQAAIISQDFFSKMFYVIFSAGISPLSKVVLGAEETLHYRRTNLALELQTWGKLNFKGHFLPN